MWQDYGSHQRLDPGHISDPYQLSPPRATVRGFFWWYNAEVMDICEDFALEVVKLAPFTIFLEKHDTSRE